MRQIRDAAVADHRNVGVMAYARSSFGTPLGGIHVEDGFLQSTLARVAQTDHRLLRVNRTAPDRAESDLLEIAVRMPGVPHEVQVSPGVIDACDEQFNPEIESRDGTVQVEGQLPHQLILEPLIELLHRDAAGSEDVGLQLVTTERAILVRDCLDDTEHGR